MFIQTGMEKILSCRMDGGIGMARKSRKNRNVESNIQTVVKKENLLDTAAYIRLSVENGGNETDETLVVQQMLVERFIEEHPDLRLEEVYIDNGFTGTNFERPGFMRLMEDVRSGKVQCIVVKDLSRFGRDYLETGYYLETILPKLNVRFIAITDDYDSSRKEDRENISVPIKNMVNAMYAKDMSKKILAAKEAQKRNGNITLSKVAFGYVRSEDKTRQVVDETVASVVRMIFQWTLLGVNKREIADRLNLLGVATPGQKEKTIQKQVSVKGVAGLNEIKTGTNYTIGLGYSNYRFVPASDGEYVLTINAVFVQRSETVPYRTRRVGCAERYAYSAGCEG